MARKLILRKTKTLTMKRSVLPFLFSFCSISLLLVVETKAQSPKKLLANGYYEQAFLKAAKKQNKKVKLKQKHASIIYESYETIYSKGSNWIAMHETSWQQSYNKLIRVIGFRAAVKHPGVYDKLENMLYDGTVLNSLAHKFNNANTNDINLALGYEANKDYLKAIGHYKQIKSREGQAKPISTLSDKITLIDWEEKINDANIKIGDEYIKEAQKLVEKQDKISANEAIRLINNARNHRPLDQDEEDLLTLANLIIGDSWSEEARKLLSTPTKRNARLAFELLNKTRSKKTLTEEEEEMIAKAKNLGTTRVLVKVMGTKPIHTNESLSGTLNAKKRSQWISYLFRDNSNYEIDFTLELNENKPNVMLGKVNKRIEQRTKQVEYWEEETDANGNKTKVKKTKEVVGMFAILDQTKTAQLNWTLSLKDLNNGQAIYSETETTTHHITHEYASLESGDILAIPDNMETEVDLDSQPFPEDDAMAKEVREKYIFEMTKFISTQKDHLKNIDAIIE